MPARVRAFFNRHPVLRDVLWWSIPALLIGAFLRGLLLSYQPYAYWGSDSKSYYSFAHLLLASGDISLDEKRRYLYPMLMVPLSLLPGAPLRWLPWIQHLLGLSAVLPLAYLARRTFRFWKWWVIPLTCLYVSIPLFLWYEHELLGETIFFAALLWAMGGWAAWVKQDRADRARALFWWFFIPLAAFLLIKPSARFVLPGIVLGLITIRAWRVLARRHWLALALLIAATLTVGSRKQGAWILYVSTFPLTQLDTPMLREYKSEIREYAQPYIENIDVYFLANKRALGPGAAPFDFLESPSEEDAPPLWSALDDDSKKKRRIYQALAWEGIKARPDGWLYLASQRFIASANLSDFGEERFSSEYYPTKLHGLYRDALNQQAKGKRTSIPMAFGLGRHAKLPPYEVFAPRLSPAPGGWEERVLTAWARGFHSVADVVKLPRITRNPPRIEGTLLDARPTALGWFVILSLLAALPFWRTLGIWIVVAAGYLGLIFLVSHTHTRFFAPAWLIFLPALFAPLELALRAIGRWGPGGAPRSAS